MRKLKLDIEDLAVESFAPAPAGTGRGTAHAHQADTVRADTVRYDADTVRIAADTVHADADTVYLDADTAAIGGGATVSVCGGICSQYVTECYPQC